jgi:hypothetical protein
VGLFSFLGGLFGSGGTTAGPAAISTDVIRSDVFNGPWRGPLDLDADGGETARSRQLYRQLYKDEGIVRSAVDGKVDAIASADVLVIPADQADATSRAIAQFVHDAVEDSDGGWDGLIGDTLRPAVLDGWSALEFTARPTDTPQFGVMHGMKHCRSLDTAFLRLQLDNYRNVVGIVSLRAGLETFDPGKVVIFTHRKLFHNPFGNSDMRAARRDAELLEDAYKLWYLALKMYGEPYLLGKVAVPERRKAMEGLLKALRQGGYAVTPDKDSIELLSLATAVNFAAFEAKVKNLRENIYLAIRGSYLPFMEGTGARDAHGDSAMGKVSSDTGEYLLARAVARTIRRQVFPHLVYPNFGPGTPLPGLSLGGINWDDVKKVGDTLAAIKKEFPKVSISAKYVTKQLGIPPAEGPEDEIGGADGPDDGGGPGPEGGGAGAGTPPAQPAVLPPAQPPEQPAPPPPTPAPATPAATSTFSAALAPRFADYVAPDRHGRYPGDLHEQFGLDAQAFAGATRLLRRQVQRKGADPAWMWAGRPAAVPAPEPPVKTFAADDQGHEHAADGKFAPKGGGGGKGGDEPAGGKGTGGEDAGGKDAGRPDYAARKAARDDRYSSADSAAETTSAASDIQTFFDAFEAVAVEEGGEKVASMLKGQIDAQTAAIAEARTHLVGAGATDKELADLDRHAARHIQKVSRAAAKMVKTAARYKAAVDDLEAARAVPDEPDPPEPERPEPTYPEEPQPPELEDEPAEPDEPDDPGDEPPHPDEYEGGEGDPQYATDAAEYPAKKAAYAAWEKAHAEWETEVEAVRGRNDDAEAEHETAVGEYEAAVEKADAASDKEYDRAYAKWEKESAAVEKRNEKKQERADKADAAMDDAYEAWVGAHGEYEGEHDSLVSGDFGDVVTDAADRIKAEAEQEEDDDPGDDGESDDDSDDDGDDDGPPAKTFSAAPADARHALAAAYAAEVLAAREADPAADVSGLTAAYLDMLDDEDLLDAAADPTATFAAGHDESKHPRGKNGRFIRKDAIAEAKGDPAKEAALREQVRPEDAGKLDDALSGKTDLGRTKKGQAKHEAGQRRKKRQASAARAKEIAGKVGDGSASVNDLYELADHLPHLTADQLRFVATGVATRGLGRTKPAMVDALRKGLREHEGRHVAREADRREKERAEVGRPPRDQDADGEAYDAARDNLDRRQGWAGDRPDSLAAQGAVEGAAARLGRTLDAREPTDRGLPVAGPKAAATPATPDVAPATPDVAPPAPHPDDAELAALNRTPAKQLTPAQRARRDQLSAAHFARKFPDATPVMLGGGKGPGVSDSENEGTAARPAAPAAPPAPAPEPTPPAPLTPAALAADQSAARANAPANVGLGATVAGLNTPAAQDKALAGFHDRIDGFAGVPDDVKERWKKRLAAAKPERRSKVWADVIGEKERVAPTPSVTGVGAAVAPPTPSNSPQPTAPAAPAPKTVPPAAIESASRPAAKPGEDPAKAVAAIYDRSATATDADVGQARQHLAGMTKPQLRAVAEAVGLFGAANATPKAILARIEDRRAAAVRRGLIGRPGGSPPAPDEPPDDPYAGVTPAVRAAADKHDLTPSVARAVHGEVARSGLDPDAVIAEAVRQRKGKTYSRPALRPGQPPTTGTYGASATTADDVRAAIRTLRDAPRPDAATITAQRTEPPAPRPETPEQAAARKEKIAGQRAAKNAGNAATAAHRTALAEHAAAPAGSLARRALDAHLSNLYGVDEIDPANPPTKTPKPRDLAQSLTSAWLEAHRLGGTAADLAPVERALAAAGVERVGAAGETATYDGRLHEAAGPVPAGARVRVVRPGWVLKEADGETRMVPAKVEAGG